MSSSETNNKQLIKIGLVGDASLGDRLKALVSNDLTLDYYAVPSKAVLNRKDVPIQHNLILYAGSLGAKTLNDLLDKTHHNHGEHILLLANNNELEELNDIACRFAGIISLEGAHASLISLQLRCYAQTASNLFSSTELARQYKSFLDIQSLPGFVLDKEMNFTEISTILCEFLGISDEHEVLGKNVSTLFTNSEDFISMKSFFDVDQGELYETEVYWQHFKKGALKIKLIVSSKSAWDGSLQGYLGIAKDLKRLSKAQKIARRHEYLEKTYRFTRSLAHEIKNPLTTIDLAVNELESDIPEDDIKKDYLDIIDRSSKRINLLLDELLSSSKSNQLQLVSYPLNDLITETQLLMEDRVELSNIDMVVNINTSDDIMCLIDYPKMQIALTNIIMNAIEAVESVEEGIVEIRSDQDNGEITIQIIDNGLGITLEEQEVLFDPFYSNKKTGVGLGLTMSQSIIKEHHGQIDLESNSGKGSNFHIILPIHSK